jgi:hypothetical protein
MLVGRNAHRHLWPEIADWMLAQADAADAALGPSEVAVVEPGSIGGQPSGGLGREPRPEEKSA